MEWMHGVSLDNHLDMTIAHPEAEVHQLIAPIFDAVIYCHQAGIPHQNITPKNLMFTDKEISTSIMKLSDLGMNNLRNIQAFLGTCTLYNPAYEAPEMIDKKDQIP